MRNRIERDENIEDDKSNSCLINIEHLPIEKTKENVMIGNFENNF